MVKVEDIFNATRGGLDIILSYYPQAAESIDTRKPFRMRNERTPSAYIKQFGEIWKVTDFGDDAHAMNAIDICMKEEGRSFREAICILADRFGVSGTLSVSINKADIRKRPANKDEKDGDFIYEEREKFTEKELEVSVAVRTIRRGGLLVRIDGSDVCSIPLYDEQGFGVRHHKCGLSS